MGKKLAIRGHSTRGKEVIELLEMMGGKNKWIYDGSDGFVYFIEKNDKYITYCGKECIKNTGEYIIYELEEFLEKYPFKVGDKVVYTKFGDDYPLIINSMKWTGTTIEYTFDGCVTCIAKDLKMCKEEPKEVISGIYLNSCDYADEVQLNLGDYEIEVRDGRTYAVLKKPVYPKTFKECRAILNYTVGCLSGYKSSLLASLQSLLVCREAYWKIAGEQMGLDEPWKHNYLKDANTIRYVIYNTGDEIVKLDGKLYRNYILCFPTEEMRDAFFKNFKKEIEQCKELL